MYKKRWGIFYEGLRLDDKTSRLFQSIGVLRYLVFGLTLVFFYFIPLIQISGIFFSSVAYLVILIFMRPYELKKDFFLALLTEFMTTLVTFFFLVLTLDENYNLVTVDTRVQIGWFIIVLTILIVLKGILLVVYPAIRGIMKLFSSKKKPEESEEESEPPAAKNEVELNTRLQQRDKIEFEVPPLERSHLNTSARKINEEESPQKLKKG